MSDDFKQIPFAPKYEIDREGSVRTVSKQVPILPYPLGGNEVRLEVEYGGRKLFSIDELVAEVFNAKAKVESPPRAAKELELPPRADDKNTKAEKPDVKKIMALDTFMSVKMWKLHEAGLSNDEISETVKYPHSNNVPVTIAKYNKSKKLRDKANKLKI